MIMGTRMWVPFFDAATDDEPSFEKRIDSVCREIGERGLCKASTRPSGKSQQRRATAVMAEGVPPAVVSPSTPVMPTTTTSEASQRPLAAPVVAANNDPSVATAATMGGMAARAAASAPPRNADQQFSPSIHTISPVVVRPPLQQQQQQSPSSPQPQSLVAQAQAGEMMLLPQQLPPSSPSAAVVVEAISSEQLVALQARIESLHTQSMLEQAELYSIEDAIADYSDLRQSLLPRVITTELANMNVVAGKVLRIVGASETFAGSDGAFARQLRRKFV